MDLFRNLGSTQLLSQTFHPFIFWRERWQAEHSSQLIASFGYVMSGEAVLTAQGGARSLKEGDYFSWNGLESFEGGTGFIVQVEGFRALNLLGGPLEARGRLNYIDGCMDTLLIPPPRLGDPCLNVLYFPPGVKQTLHTHPSVRVGLVVRGAGWCYNETTTIPLQADDLFVIHPEEVHAFETREEGMTVLAFHPDSDFGPQDRDHPMINRTLVAGVSASQIPEIQTR